MGYQKAVVERAVRKSFSFVNIFKTKIDPCILSLARPGRYLKGFAFIQFYYVVFHVVTRQPCFRYWNRRNPEDKNKTLLILLALHMNTHRIKCKKKAPCLSATPAFESLHLTSSRPILHELPFPMSVVL